MGLADPPPPSGRENQGEAMLKIETIRVAGEVAGQAGQVLFAGAIGMVLRLARFWGETAAMVRELRER
jgi:hypothetical protein